MQKIIDLSSQRFGLLFVQHIDDNSQNKYTKWVCKCDCGNIVVVRGADLKNGHTTSCGCKRKLGTQLTHGQSNTRLYHIWKGMKARCYNKNEPQYKNYGAIGIKICDEWINNFQSFFDWSIQNGYSDLLTIDRINVYGNYEPNNCRWLTLSEQSVNKRNTIFIEINGIIKPMKEWCDIYNISYSIVQQRYKKILKNNIKCDDISIIFKSKTLFLTNRKKPSFKKEFKDYRDKPIIQYDINNVPIKEWSSIKEIKQTNLFNKNAVLNCCYGLSKTHKGYIWRYKLNNYPAYNSK